MDRKQGARAYLSRMRRLPDTQLIALVREGSSEAASVLFDRYWEFTWRVAYAVVSDPSLADDVAQDAIQRAFASLGRFDEMRPFGPWIKRIAANAAVDQLRRGGRLAALDDAMLTRRSTASDGDETDVRLLAVAEAVSQLGAAKRVVVVLRYWLDLPLDEIAGVLGIPVGTVASRLSRALDEVRVALEDERVV